MLGYIPKHYIVKTVPAMCVGACMHVYIRVCVMKLL